MCRNMVSTCCGKWPMVNTSSNSGRKMEKREKQNEKEVYGKRQRDIGRKRVRGRKKERKRRRHRMETQWHKEKERSLLKMSHVELICFKDDDDR